jgi:hypothetical protein
VVGGSPPVTQGYDRFQIDEDELPPRDYSADRRFVGISLVVAAVIMALVLTDACAHPSTKWGRPEFFGRVAGLEMEVGEPRYWCRRGPRRGTATVATWSLTPAQIEWYMDPPESFRALPAFYDPPDGRELRPWQTGLPEPRDRKLWGSAIASIYYALSGPDCDSDFGVKEAAAEARLALTRPTTHYAYVYLSQVNKPYLLEYYMIDPVAGLIWVIEANQW